MTQRSNRQAAPRLLYYCENGQLLEFSPSILLNFKDMATNSTGMPKKRVLVVGAGAAGSSHYNPDMNSYI
jgi:hypothetical protein